MYFIMSLALRKALQFYNKSDTCILQTFALGSSNMKSMESYPPPKVFRLFAPDMNLKADRFDCRLEQVQLTYVPTCHTPETKT